jgi:hypothetical protein
LFNILKISTPAISSSLAYICVFPTGLKYSDIIPLFKNGDKTNMMNCRPISLLTSSSKVTEKVICVRLLRHLKIVILYPIINMGSGARHIYNLINKILKALDNKIPAVGIFFFGDLNKAFDFVNHNVLLSKLKFYGIAGKANKKYVYSSWGKTVSGVLQGSILGPILFCYILMTCPLS